MKEHKVVMVTGTSSGIGQAIAGLMAQKGFCVLGTSRHPSANEAIPGVEVLPLDVCSDESVDECWDRVLTRFGRLDVLINNAGYIQNGAAEEVSLDETKAQFETNLFGVMRMIKSALPGMRRQGHGQIINVSSLVSLIPLPFASVYAASKGALEAYTEALRHEVSPFNIKVSLVEPSFIKTNLLQNTRVPAIPVTDYDPWRRRVQEGIRESGEKAPPPSVVANCVLSIVESSSPKLRYQVGGRAKPLFMLHRLMPERMFEQQVRRTLRLDAR